MKSKTKTQSKQSSTTNPIVPGWITNAVQGQQNRINNLGAGGADQYVAPTSPLQDMAFSGGQALANRMGLLSNDAASGQVASTGPGVSRSPGFQSGPIEGMGSPEISNAPGTFSRAGEKYQAGAPNQGGLLSSAPELSSAPGAQSGPIMGGGLTSPDPNMMFTGAGLLAANAGTAGANTADRNVLGGAPTIDDAGAMDAAQISNNEITRLMNPYQQNVINSSLAQFDNARREAEARMAADAAGRGAFSDGRYGLAEGQFNADAVRDRASLEAGLRADGYNSALGAADSEANRRQQASGATFDANLQRLLANQGVESAYDFNQFGADNTLNMFNAGQGDNALMRQLSAAGLLGDLGRTVGSEDRANLGLLSGLGEQQRGVDQDMRNAEPLLAQLIASLNAQQGYGNFIGQTSQGESSGTSTSSQNALGMMAGLGGTWLAGGGGNPFLFGSGK